MCCYVRTGVICLWIMNILSWWLLGVPPKQNHSKSKSSFCIATQIPCFNPRTQKEGNRLWDDCHPFWAAEGTRALPVQSVHRTPIISFTWHQTFTSNNSTQLRSQEIRVKWNSSPEYNTRCYVKHRKRLQWWIWRMFVAVGLIWVRLALSSYDQSTTRADRGDPSAGGGTAALLAVIL